MGAHSDFIFSSCGTALSESTAHIKRRPEKKEVSGKMGEADPLENAREMFGLRVFAVCGLP